MEGKRKNNREVELSFIKNIRVTDVSCYIFLVLFFGIYPIIMDNNYFNITVTRYRFFCYAAGIFIALFALGYIVEYAVGRHYHYPEYLYDSGQEKRVRCPDFWMLAFLMANVFAWICAEDKKAALNGSNGRFMGLLMYVFLAAVFLLLAKRYRGRGYVLLVLFATAAFSFVVAVGQHMEKDFMHYKDNMSSKQYTQFISTFGNINMFACFLTVTIPMFATVFIFGKRLWSRLLACILLALAGCCILISNSDSVFLGLFVGMAILFFLALRREKLAGFFLSLAVLAGGNLALALINRYAHTRYDKKRGGLALTLNRLDVALLLFAVTAVIALAVFLCKKRFGERLHTWDKKKVSTGVLIAGGVLLAVGLAVGILSGSSYFKFDYNWGTYRGYIWTKTLAAFRDAPAVNKIFGYGNESLREVLSIYHDEMLSVTGRVYDNAHNELLQYLVTTGMAGLVSYLGLFVSSVTYLWKNSGDNLVVYACLSAACGYFAQGLLNLNQPITTPFFFVLLGLGIGSVRYWKKVEEMEGNK